MTFFVIAAIAEFPNGHVVKIALFLSFLVPVLGLFHQRKIIIVMSNSYKVLFSNRNKLLILFEKLMTKENNLCAI